MATLNISYGTRTEFGTDTNVNSLASNITKAIGAVSNTATAGGSVGYKIDATIYLATTGVTSTGTIVFYMVESTDGTNYVDGINVTATTDQTSSIKSATVVYSAAANANSQVVRIVFDLPRQFAPKYYSLLVQNSTGATISSASNSVYYTPISHTIA